HGVGWPVAAVDFMEREGLKGNCFADPNMGAYLVWRLGPERVRCHADTRGFFFPPEVLEDGVAILRMEGDWEERLRRVLNRGTDWFLLPVQGPDSVLWQALRQEVKPAYVDGQVALIKAGAVRDWLKKRVTSDAAPASLPHPGRTTSSS